MKLLQETKDATSDRKLIKSQVEKRRRERINRSLERLRTMLLQEPQQGGGTQHRVEKAEILERTVLFLQNTAKGDKAEAGGGSGGQKHSFQDGFSTCLQRAAQFLGPEGKGMWLGSVLDASFTARLSRSYSDAVSIQRKTTISLPHTKFILRMLRQKSKHRLHARVFRGKSSAYPYPLPAHRRFPRVPQQPQRQSQLDIRPERRASKQSLPQSYPVSQTLWRPWP